MRRRHTTKEEALLKKWGKLMRWVFGKGSRRPISRKKHPLDCGQPGCATCHSDKIDGHEPTRQERIADLKSREDADR
jgi:hypothetical protein